MSSVPEPLAAGEKSRLMPTVKDSKREDRATSILLAMLRVVPSFGKAMLSSVGQKIGVNAKIHCYSQVQCLEPPDCKLRPDGLIRVERGGKVWTCLIEAKIGNQELEKEQLLNYLELAKLNKIDALITISNQFAAQSSHHPVSLGFRERKGIDVYHWSWLFAVTQGLLVQNSDDGLNPTQKLVLEDFLEYFEHESTGVKGFNQMNPEWKTVVQDIVNGALLKKTSEAVSNTVSAWHQESRDLCLIMSRELEVPVKEKLPRKHIKDPEQRIRDVSDTLISYHELECVLEVPDAASPLHISANLARRSISCAMTLAAPTNKQSCRPQVTWLLRQLSDAQGDSFYIRAWHRNMADPMQESLETVRNDPLSLIAEGKGRVLFSRFEILLVRDLAAKFSGSKSFIQNLEELVLEYYAEVGQHLRAWVRPAPKSQTSEVPTSTADYSQAGPTEFGAAISGE